MGELQRTGKRYSGIALMPLLDAIGGKGVYITAKFRSEREAEEMASKVEAYR